MTSPPLEPEVHVPQLRDLSHLDHGPVPGFPDPYPSRRFEDYIEVGGFLVPRDRHTPFGVTLRDPGADGSVYDPLNDEWHPRSDLMVARLQGEAEIRAGVARVTRLEIDYADAITSHLLARVPMAEIAVSITAQVSLTVDKDRHYRVIEAPGQYETPEAFIRHLFEVMDLQREASESRGPAPSLGEPEPVLIGPDGRAWYRVRLTSEPVRALRRLKRTKMDEPFLAGVRAAYLQARAEGRSTTRAVAAWHERLTGRTPATPSVDRYIRLAKQHYGEEFFNA